MSLILIICITVKSVGRNTKEKETLLARYWHCYEFGSDSVKCRSKTFRLFARVKSTA